jgi:hypothetical protein
VISFGIFIFSTYIDGRGLISDNIDFTAGRFTNIKLISSFVFSGTNLLNNFIGFGVGNLWILTTEYYGFQVLGTHNFYLDILFEFGIIGAILYVYLIFSPIFKSRSKVFQNYALVSILVSGMVMTFIDVEFFYIMLPIVICSGRGVFNEFSS